MVIDRKRRGRYGKRDYDEMNGRSRDAGGDSLGRPTGEESRVANPGADAKKIGGVSQAVSGAAE